MKRIHFNYKRLSIVDTLLITIIFGLVTFSAIAEDLRDPTQLPMSIAASNMSNSEEKKHVVQYGPVLQSVILSSRTKGAIISGERINIGEQFQDKQLVSITENSAVLRAKNGTTQTLTMQHNDVKQTLKITKHIKKGDLNHSTRTITQHINVR